MTEKRNYRNRHGVKDASDCWRTIDGEHFIAWMSFPSQEYIAALRKAGVKCRRFGDELFIREADKDAAAVLTRAWA